MTMTSSTPANARDGSAYASNSTIEEIARRVRDAGRIVVTTHVKPDGDAVGSSIALARAIETLGKRVSVWYIPPLMNVFTSVTSPTRVHLVGDSTLPPDDVDLILITDTGARSQLRELDGWLTRHRGKVCVIDHHVQGDADLSTWRVVEPRASAASELAARLIDALGVPKTRAIAEPLYVGIATDTGWFRFSNVRAETFRLAAELLDCGADHSAIFHAIEQTDHPSRLRLLARALGSMELVERDRAAIITLRLEDFKACDASPDDTHGFSDLPHCIGSVEVVCVIAEAKPGVVKLSLRSKPGPDAIDVNALARQFGGGGHARASGAKVPGNIEDVRCRLVVALDQIFA